MASAELLLNDYIESELRFVILRGALMQHVTVTCFVTKKRREKLRTEQREWKKTSAKCDAESVAEEVVLDSSYFYI